jgi:arabinogalactan oligomer/maltooligosaccharide transport system permease protein
LPKALRGLWTLGETPRVLINGKFPKVYDHSTNILIIGLFVVILFAFYLIAYIYNIRDAYDTGRERSIYGTVKSFSQTIRNILTYSFPYVLLTIPVIGVFIFTILPLIFMILLAFTNYNLQHIPPSKLVDWVGFSNFADLIQLSTYSYTFYKILIWTFIWAILATITTYFGGMFVALLIEQNGVKFKAFWRTIFIIPYAIPQLISLLIMRNLFNGQFGPINQYLAFFGIQNIDWLGDPFWAKFTVIVVNMWLGVPVSMVLILGVLTTIPKDLYEAADVDGATDFQKFRAITLPMIIFSTTPLLIMQFAGNINNFNVIFLLTNGNPPCSECQFAGETDLLVTWLYKLTLNQSMYNMASAVGIIIFVIISTFSVWNYRRSKSYQEEDMVQ